MACCSRVGIVGPNGAGKSTLIKLLTVSSIRFAARLYPYPAFRVKRSHRRGLYTSIPPCESVTSPNMRLITLVGRIMHCLLLDPDRTFAERHLEKTPIQYIQWRFQDGHDRRPKCLFCVEA